MNHMIESNAARALARQRGMFARVSALGNSLVFYTGNEKDPGTWLEAGRLLLDDRNCVSRHGLNLILEPKAVRS